jgi:uroporphyrinogen-III synthase
MQKTLYLGLEVPAHHKASETTHYPIIRILPRPAEDATIKDAFTHFDLYTHVIFTSKSAVSIFCILLETFRLDKTKMIQKKVIAVGRQTAARLRENGLNADLIATEETAEGIVNMLNPSQLSNAHLFLPQSALSRSLITDWLKKHHLTFTACPLYDTVANLIDPLPDLTLFDTIVFTSPSTIDAFIQGYGSLPQGKKLDCIGPITQRHLDVKKGSHEYI